MFKDYVMFALKTFTARKIRTLLTMIGIFIGIAVVVSLISLGQGLQAAVSQQFSILGKDKIFVEALSPAFGAPGTFAVAEINDHDLEEVRRTSGVEVAIGRVIGSVPVEFSKKVSQIVTGSVPVDDDAGRRLIYDSFRLTTSEGRLLNKGDGFKVVVGNNIALSTNVFKKEVHVGDKFLVDGKTFEVVGILAKTGVPFFDSGMIMPEDTLADILKKGKTLNAIVAQISPGEDIEKVADNIAKSLRRHRGLKEGKEDFEVQTPESLLRTFNTVFTIVQAVLIGIAAISLIVGGIGIMNTMYTSVVERTKEIGIMKAIGARNGDILSIFMIEAGMLGLVGGAYWIVVGRWIFEVC